MATVTFSDGKAGNLKSCSAKFGRRRSTVGCPVQPILYKLWWRLRSRGAGCVMWCGMLSYCLIELDTLHDTSLGWWLRPFNPPPHPDPLHFSMKEVNQ